MRYLEVRRHSQRVKPGQHLSQWGVNLARRVGETRGPFAQVASSPLPRCVETAVAMGFAVDEELAALAGPDGRGETFPAIDRVDWAAGYAGFARLIAEGGALAAFALAQAALWRGIVQALSDGESALLITHGGAYLEGPAVLCLPHGDYHAWGPSSGYCEGIRLQFDGDRCAQGEILRVEQSAPS